METSIKDLEIDESTDMTEVNALLLKWNTTPANSNKLGDFMDNNVKICDEIIDESIKL